MNLSELKKAVACLTVIQLNLPCRDIIPTNR